jgi:hypothetical protein
MQMIESARDAFMCVYICRIFHGYGKLERLNTRCLAEADNWYGLVYEGAQSVCDFVELGGNDYEQKLYFSDPPMLEYYRLCREYCQAYGVSLKNNPFMKKANDYVNSMMYYNISGRGYGWMLHTRINHERASGILFAFSSDSFGYHDILELTEVMLEICKYYEDEVKALKKALKDRKRKAAKAVKKEAA